MAPSALGFGAGGEFRSPMAIAVIGGLLVSTLLSLLFVPALFTIMDDVGKISSAAVQPVHSGRRIQVRAWGVNPDQERRERADRPRQHASRWSPCNCRAT